MDNFKTEQLRMHFNQFSHFKKFNINQPKASTVLKHSDYEVHKNHNNVPFSIEHVQYLEESCLSIALRKYQGCDGARSSFIYSNIKYSTSRTGRWSGNQSGKAIPFMRDQSCDGHFHCILFNFSLACFSRTQ